MTDDDLPFTPVHVLAPMIAPKELSPVELTEAVLDRVARVKPSLRPAL